jgi:hypothetical protein
MPFLRIVAIVMCLVPITATSQVIDPNFISPLPLAVPEISFVKIQPDGRILLGGLIDFYGNDTRHSLIRLNADGTLDDTFAYPFEARNSAVIDGQLKSNGQIVVTDGVNIYTLNSDGQIANTFEREEQIEYIFLIRLLSNGKALVTGYNFS